MTNVFKNLNEQKVVSIDINKIKSTPLVTNMDKSTLAYLMKSIGQIGVISPGIVDNQYNILSGHRRYLCAKELQNKTFPCIVVDELTDELKKQIEIDSHNSQRYLTFISQIIITHIEFEMYDKKENGGVGYTRFNAEQYAEGIRNGQKRVKNAKAFYLLKETWQNILIQIDINNEITKENIENILLCDDDTLEEFFKLVEKIDLEKSILDNKELNKILAEAKRIIRKKNINGEIEDIAKKSDEAIDEKELKQIITNHKEIPELSNESIKMVLRHQINNFLNIEDKNDSCSFLEEEYKLDFSEEIKMMASQFK